MSLPHAVPFADETAEDPAVTALLAEPFSVRGPQEPATPFLFASPHSGRAYPPSFLKASRLDAVTLRRSEDAFVDELFGAAPEAGATLIAAHFPRAYVDVNRAESEWDPAMFDGPVALPPTAKSARVAAGLGVIPRVVRDGLEIYRHRLSPREAQFRMDGFYRPYHARLAGLIADRRARLGTAVVIDCHSMPPPARGHDIVLGDCYGEAAAPQLSAYIHTALSNLGYSVGRNAPYAGGHTTRLYGKPAAGVHAVQIEINRALYLDEKRMEKTAGFAACRKQLARFVCALVAETALWLPAAAG